MQLLTVPPLYDEEGNAVEEFNAEISARGCEKAAKFVEFCDAFNIPVLTLTNAAGFKATKCTEKKMAKAAAARLTYAFAEASCSEGKCSSRKSLRKRICDYEQQRSIGADVVYAWPNAKIGMMDAKTCS